MAPISGFVQRLEQQLLVAGKPYRIVGGNLYALGYWNPETQKAGLDLAEALGLNSLRIWAFLDAATAPGQWDVCFQYKDPATGSIVPNEGPNGLERLDHAVAMAGERGMRVILTLVNNWKDFGGMPCYCGWFGIPAERKNLFYTDEQCRRAYRTWVEGLIQRRNTVTGLLYRDDPAILAWELANEPRCEDPHGLKTLLHWVEEMSGVVKASDSNHLISVGDEGYFNHLLAWRNPLYDGQYGVSCDDLLAIEAIDFGTTHMYPQDMAKDKDSVAFGRTWIREHIEAGRRANKPMLIEEYGMKVGGPGELADQPSRNGIFDSWLRYVEELGGVGDMLWMLALPKGPDQWYDPDHYGVFHAEDAFAIRAHARRMLGT